MRMSLITHFSELVKSILKRLKNLERLKKGLNANFFLTLTVTICFFKLRLRIIKKSRKWSKTHAKEVKVAQMK